jgi:hypothetical protein
MAKRDPEKTARNKVIESLTAHLKTLLPDVLSETGIKSGYSLHGLYDGKFADLVKIYNHCPILLFQLIQHKVSLLILTHNSVAAIVALRKRNSYLLLIFNL